VSGFNDDLAAGQGTLIRTVLKSDNYVPGVFGWAIFRDGTSEFNNTTIRGVLVVGPATGARVAIDDVPAELIAEYVPGSFTSISTVTIQMFANSTDYYYWITGIAVTDPDNIALAMGSVQGGKVHEHTSIFSRSHADGFAPDLINVNFDRSGGNANHPVGTWTFGANFHPLLTPGAGNFEICNCTINLGRPFAAGDDGHLNVNIPTTFTTNAATAPVFAQGADFQGDIIADVAAALAFAGGLSVRITDFHAVDISITPSAINTPTSATVNYGRTLKGTKTFVLVAPHTGVPQNVHVGTGTFTMSSNVVTLTRSDSATATTITVVVVATG